MNGAQLAAAFDEWLRRSEQDPEDFEKPSREDYGSRCAAYLLKLLAEQET